MAERKIDFAFDSTRDNGKKIQLANGYVSDTGIEFTNENFVALISASGKVELYREDKMVAKAELPKEDSGKCVYDAVICTVNGDLVELSFPVYEWIDNYPHCDGEHDRWDTREIGREKIGFDFVKCELK